MCIVERIYRISFAESALVFFVCICGGVTKYHTEYRVQLQRFLSIYIFFVIVCLVDERRQR